MSDRSAIEWTDATWSPVTGCTRVSPGCANCYIERTPPFRIEGRRFERVGNEETTGVRLHPERLDIPLHWRKPRRVFVCSLSDLFHEQVPDEFIADVFDTMRAASNTHGHVFQVLTKRPERMRDVLNRLRFNGCGDGRTWITEKSGALDGYALMGGLAGCRPLPNVWLGVSIENARYTWRADVLREIPAAARFISAEPLLGSLFATGEKLSGVSAVMARKPLDLTDISWVIVGGESGGRNARPMHPDWARELRDACMLERVCIEHAHGLHPWARKDCAACTSRPAFFFKQWGSWVPYEDNAQPPFWYAGASPKSGGRMLDGREWNEMPRMLDYKKEGVECPTE